MAPNQEQPMSPDFQVTPMDLSSPPQSASAPCEESETQMDVDVDPFETGAGEPDKISPRPTTPVQNFDFSEPKTPPQPIPVLTSPPPIRPANRIRPSFRQQHLSTNRFRWTCCGQIFEAESQFRAHRRIHQEELSRRLAGWD